MACIESAAACMRELRCLCVNLFFVFFFCFCFFFFGLLLLNVMMIINPVLFHTAPNRLTAYIDKKKTIPEGRRVAKASCCENPLPSGKPARADSAVFPRACSPHLLPPPPLLRAEIMEVCDYLNLPAVLEADKCYPRDILARGRVRVMIKKADGNPVHLSINNRMVRSPAPAAPCLCCLPVSVLPSCVCAACHAAMPLCCLPVLPLWIVTWSTRNLTSSNQHNRPHPPTPTPDIFHRRSCGGWRRNSFRSSRHGRPAVAVAAAEATTRSAGTRRRRAAADKRSPPCGLAQTGDPGKIKYV